MDLKQKTHGFDIAIMTVVLLALVLAWSLSRSYALVEQAGSNVSNIGQNFNRTKPITATESSAPSLADIRFMQMENFSHQLADSLGQFVVSQPNTYGVLIKHLESGQVVGSGENQTMITASLYKTFAAMAALRLVDAGQANLDEVLARGEGQTLKQCIQAAISISDNPCGHALLARTNLSSPDGLKLLHELGYKHTDMRGDYPVSTASDVAKLYEDLYQQKLLSAKSNQFLLETLKNQKINDRLPTGLPTGTEIAHKTGDLEGAIHDAGIVYNDQGDYIIVVMSLSGDRSPNLSTGERYDRIATLAGQINNIMLQYPQIVSAQ